MVLFAVNSDQHRDKQLARCRKWETSEYSALKGTYVSYPSSPVAGIIAEEGHKMCKNTGRWVATKTQCILDATGQLHIWFTVVPVLSCWVQSAITSLRASGNS